MALRLLDSGLVQEIRASQLRPFLATKMEFDAGDLNLWTGYGPLTFFSETWIGAGRLGKVNPLRETDQAEGSSITFELSGVPNDALAIALGEDYQGRPFTLYFGALDAAGAVIGAPVETAAGLLDVMEIREGPDTSVILVRGTDDDREFAEPKVVNYTEADQQALYPNDNFFKFVNALQEVEVIWTRED